MHSLDFVRHSQYAPRMTLYPKLEDHDLVKDYPPVQGMGKNVFFLSHNHKENGGEDESVSKYNSFEVSLLLMCVVECLMWSMQVEMIVDLVMYLIR